VFEPGLLSTGDDESHAVFSPDGNELYFLLNTSDFRHWTIVGSRFLSGRWTAPEVAPFSGRYSDADPAFSPDGQTLYFISTRPVDGKGPERRDTDIWRMRKTDAGWGEPEHPARLSSETDEWLPTVTASGTLYFGSSRPGGKGGTDVWRSRLVDGEYAEPENLGEPVNTPALETEPFVASDESYMILAAGRPEGLGAYDLYVSYNCAGSWSKPENLGKEINSIAWDFAPRVTPDGRYLFFASNRSAFEGPLERRLGTKELTEALHRPGNGLRDIYRVDVSALGLRSPCPTGAGSAH
jgi:Tol biopolymer transport system component